MLEARDRLGGRVWDDHSTGACVGRGAQIVNGTTNNPISLLCHQVCTSLVSLCLPGGGAVVLLSYNESVKVSFDNCHLVIESVLCYVCCDCYTQEILHTVVTSVLAPWSIRLQYSFSGLFCLWPPVSLQTMFSTRDLFFLFSTVFH